MKVYKVWNKEQRLTSINLNFFNYHTQFYLSSYVPYIIVLKPKRKDYLWEFSDDLEELRNCTVLVYTYCIISCLSYSRGSINVCGSY